MFDFQSFIINKNTIFEWIDKTNDLILDIIHYGFCSKFAQTNCNEHNIIFRIIFA